MDNQPKRVEYKIGDDIMSIIENTLYDTGNGRVSFTTPSPQRNITIETGIGGLGGIKEHIVKQSIESGLVVNGSDTIGHSFPIQKYTIPFLAGITFVLQPDKDKLESDDETNPMLNGYRTSSHCYTMMEDGKIIAEIVCVGKRPVFSDGLFSLIIASGTDTKYDMSAAVIKKYLMNCLNNLK